MTNKDIDFFQGIINDILRYITSAEISNEQEEQRQAEHRALFKVIYPSQWRSSEDLQLNKQNIEFWTVKELRDMPFLKDVKYRQLKNGIHQFRYRRDGFNVSFNSKDLKIAKEKAKAFILDLKKKMGDNAFNVNTLDNVAQLWFGAKKHHVVPATLRSYISVYDNHVKPKFGSRKIKDILPMNLQPFFDNLSGTKGKTCENAKIILNGVFDFAVANRICLTNPMQGVIIDKHVRKAGKALSNEQIMRFENVMHSLGGVGTAYLIILHSGIRGAELEQMTFDWENGTFTVLNAKLKKSQRSRAENLRRIVPIFPGLFALRERIEKEDWRMAARIVSNTLCRFWTESTVKDLRHTFISKARLCDVENELVNLWTGHLPGNNVTANVYTHFPLDFQKREAEKIRF